MEQPDKIGKYEVRSRLGQGATSTVWLAWDPFAQREVAIKVISQEVLRDKERGKLYRHLLVNEASLAGKLVHPHIVQIHDAVVDDALSYIVMEYVAGGTLEPFCTPDNLLPLDRLVEIIFKCTRALDYAYHLGITHRDIKPANILLAASDNLGGDIKISDFGAALFSSGEVTRTQVSGIGSPAYMSPQQVREMPLNHQTDIYSLGVVMYQLLTGRLPFQASNNYSMVYQITHDAPPPPSDFRREIPGNLDAIIARAMQKDLGARYASWEEFSHDLAQAFRNKQLKARERDFADTEKYETLRGLSFFADFSDVEIWEVVRFSDWDQVAPETVIMKDGEPGDYFCFLADGEVRINKRGRILSILTPGDCFGEMAVISQTSSNRNADVVAQTPAKIITIRGDALRQASEVCRMHFYAAFLGVLANRLALANARLASV
ncbi:MAG: protein kinase [Betaproteobacteria bacterium]|nr:protein kinase [Betaproteobacteria bacterium]